MNIRYLRHSEIDFDKWDVCLRNSTSPMIYAESWYLDVVASGEWDGLVAGDYEVIMPLPRKRKFGIIPHFYQPPFCQQLGVFAPETPSEELIGGFISKIPPLPYRLNLNYDNPAPNATQRDNFCLPLNAEFAVITENFSQNTRRNIAKAKESEVSVSRDNSPRAAGYFIEFYQTQPKPYELADQSLLNTLLYAANEKGRVEFYFARSAERDLLAALALLLYEGRLTYFMPISSTEGKEHRAMFLIIENIIETYQQSEFILDFEGSMLPNLARFYQGFGAENQPYSQIKRWV